MNNKDKIFYEKLEKIQAEHAPDSSDTYKCNWKKEWLPFIKYDADWDGGYLLDLIIYKLEKMHLYLQTYSFEVKSDLKKRLAKLEKTISLGKKIQTYDYEAEASEWQNKHFTNTIIYKDKDDNVVYTAKRKHLDLDKINNVEEILNNFFGKESFEEWSAKNNYVYTFDDLLVLHSGYWDADENYEIWKKKLKEAYKRKQDDNDKFFKLIARNYEGWWC